MIPDNERRMYGTSFDYVNYVNSKIQKYSFYAHKKISLNAGDDKLGRTCVLN